MTAQAKNTMLEWLKWLLLPALGAAFTFGALGSTIRGDLSRLDARVDTEARIAFQGLSNAISVRKAEQAAAIAPIIQDVESQKQVMREMAEVLKTLASGQKVTNETMARFDERLTYLAKGQDEIKQSLREKPNR